MKLRIVILVLILGIYFYLDKSKPPRIYLKINDQQEVFMDDVKLSIENIEPTIDSIVSTYSKKQQGNFIVHITADSSVRTGLILDVKQELRKADALRVMYEVE